MEDEEDCKADAGKASGVIPAKLFAEIGHGEDCEDSERDNFLNSFELRCAEFERANTIGWDLEAVFEKSDSPAGKDDFPEGFAAVLEMTVPGESHEDVGDGK